MNKVTLATGVVAAGIMLFLYSAKDAEMPEVGTLESKEVISQPITPSMQNDIPGLTVEIITPGSGAEVLTGQTVVVDYTGSFMDGKVFDSSVPRGQPFTVQIGKGQVIKGWDIGIVGMKVGEVRKLTIAPELAYGSAGAGGVIPPDSTLVFEVTLRAVK